jgi:membrane protein YdbS with pleckstrin-like domain
MVFASKIDTWLVAVAVGGPVLALAFVLFGAFRSGGPWAAVVFAAVAVFAVLAFVSWLFASTDYRVAGGLLTIRSGPLRWRIPVGDIESVTATRNPLSSPALSLDRLQIRYRSAASESDILVSPKDKEGFIAALRASNPAIRAG